MSQAKCDNLLRWYVYVEGRDRPMVTWAETAEAAKIKANNAGKQVHRVAPAPPLGTPDKPGRGRG